MPTTGTLKGDRFTLYQKKLRIREELKTLQECAKETRQKLIARVIRTFHPDCLAESVASSLENFLIN